MTAPDPRREVRAAMAMGLLGLSCLLLAACGPDRAAGAAADPNAAAVDSPYAALARGRVEAVDGLRRIGPPRAGRIERWAVQIGDKVQTGQVLAVLDGREAKAALAQAQADLVVAQAQADAAQARLPTLRQLAERLHASEVAGASSGQQSDDAQSAWSDAQAQARVQAAALASARTRVELARSEVAALQVTSPVAGELLQRGAQAGENVDVATALAHVLPDGARVVRAEVPEGMVDRVRTDMRAEIVPTSDDHVAQRARVLRIAPVVGLSRLVDPGAGETPADPRTVECVLQFEASPTAPPWRVGQTVLVRFLR